MNLLVQPEAGLQPVLDAMNSARHTLEVLIFRLDCAEVEQILLAAVQRGVAVKALIAHTNHGGDKALRQLASRLRRGGAEVFRTAGDLVRYHGKMLIVDRTSLHLLAFNFTELDIKLSRSFAVTLRDPAVVAEAQRLFACDCRRAEYVSHDPQLLVSPVNARPRLRTFVEGATSRLLLYEMKLSDHSFLKLLNRKAAAGVDVRVLCPQPIPGAQFAVRLPAMRLHARAMVRDGQSGFLGSMSLRRLELDARREVGVLFDDPDSVRDMAAVFERDWSAAAPSGAPALSESRWRRKPVMRISKALARL